MKLSKRIRRLERRLAELERRTHDLPPTNDVRSTPIDVDDIWRNHVADYATGYDDTEIRHGYL